MRSKITRWVTAAVFAPLMAACYAGGCTANVLRDVASELEDAANDIDGQDKDVDLGDFLSDLVDGL